MENKNAARFLAFDSLKGLKEAIEEVDEKNISATLLSEDKKEEMDFLIYQSYVRDNLLHIRYMKKGVPYAIVGNITKIDSLKHIIWINGGKKIYLAQITSIEEA